MPFSHNNVSRILSRRSGYYFVDICSKETWMVVSLNEKSSAPKGMQCWIVCFFKVFLTIYTCPVVWSRSNMEDRVYRDNKTSICYLQMARVIMYYSIEWMFSRDGGVCAIHFESVVENIKKIMLTVRRLLRSRPELNSSTAHIFWYMMDKHMYFWCHPGITCSHCSHERFLKCAHIIFGFWIENLTENANHSTMRHFEAFNQW